MASGIPYDSPEGRAICGALSAIMTGVAYATSAEMAERARDLPGLRAQRRRHAARDPQPSPRRLRPQGRLREARHRAGAARCRLVPRRPADRGGQARLGQRHRARPGARLPQRAGDRDRADRHHRPGDGLRHHRHRARLRAGEVQEAGRRRLLQDHQPGRAGGAAHAGLRRGRDRRDRSLCGGPRHAGAGAGHQPHHAEGQGLHRRDPAQGRRRAEDGVRHLVRVQQVDARRGVPDPDAEDPGREAATSRASTCSPTSASRRRTSRRPTSTCAGP